MYTDYLKRINNMPKAVCISLNVRNVKTKVFHLTRNLQLFCFYVQRESTAIMTLLLGECHTNYFSEDLQFIYINVDLQFIYINVAFFNLFHIKPLRNHY